MPVPDVPHGLDLAELKSAEGLYLKQKTAVSDPWLKELMAGVVGFVEGHTKRRLSPYPADGTATTITREVTDQPIVRVPDLRVVEWVKLDGVELDEGPAGYTLHRTPDELESPAPIVELHVAGRSLEVRGKFGFEELPWVLKDAIYRHVARNFNERAAGFSDADRTEEFGDRIYLRHLPQQIRDVYEQFVVLADRYSVG